MTSSHSTVTFRRDISSAARRDISRARRKAFGWCHVVTVRDVTHRDVTFKRDIQDRDNTPHSGGVSGEACRRCGLQRVCRCFDVFARARAFPPEFPAPIDASEVTA